MNVLTNYHGDDMTSVEEPCTQRFKIDTYISLLKTKHYSPRTIKKYTKWVIRFDERYTKLPVERISQSEINIYLTKLATRKNVSASTQNQALAALLFYFRYIKGDDPKLLESVVRAKKPVRLPVVFSRTEVHDVIANLEGEKQLIAKLLYGTGMRLSECLCLRVLDIDFAQNEIM